MASKKQIEARKKLHGWFEQQGWTPKPFQKKAWKLYREGQHGLITAPTGAGKTWAAFLGAFEEALATPEPLRGVQVLYLSPLRSLTNDVNKAVAQACRDLLPHWRCETRTSDTTSYQRRKQKQNPPAVLMTTPESLAILLSSPTSQDMFSDLKLAIVDEWHDLLPNKRGVLLQLNIRRLMRLAKKVRIWGLSATLADPDSAGEVLIGQGVKLVKAPPGTAPKLQTLLPKGKRLPISGHYGTKLLPVMVADISWEVSSLIFVNTRAQAETWYRLLHAAFPDRVSEMAIHHGSLARELRVETENGVKDGAIKLVVCTSSLDLGVDFPTVDRVYQIGSPKSTARLVQRAGRSKHRPGERSEMRILPTFELELLEIQALRRQLAVGGLETVQPPLHCLDVLIQHVVSTALAGGFRASELFDEIRQVYSFRSLDLQTWNWILEFVTTGGACLSAYDNHHRLKKVGDSYLPGNLRAERLHRMNIGTIVEDASIRVQLQSGKRLGQIEERFIAGLKPKDQFYFQGRLLRLVRIRESAAIVKPASKGKAITPQWLGGRLNASALLAEGYAHVSERDFTSLGSVRERQHLEWLKERQAEVSALPRAKEMLVEICSSREGQHYFFYPFCGRAAHHAQALVVAWRLMGEHGDSVSLSASDWGFEIHTPRVLDLTEQKVRSAFAEESFFEDLQASANLTELARQHFREIAGISVICPKNQPGKRKSSQQLRVSSSLLFNVFDRFEADSPLLEQARAESTGSEFATLTMPIHLQTLREKTLKIVEIRGFSPFSIHLLVDRLSARMSLDSVEKRIEKILNFQAKARP